MSVEKRADELIKQVSSYKNKIETRRKSEFVTFLQEKSEPSQPENLSEEASALVYNYQQPKTQGISIASFREQSIPQMFASERQLNYFNKISMPYPKEWTDAQITQLSQPDTAEALNKQLAVQSHNFLMGLEKQYDCKNGGSLSVYRSASTTYNQLHKEINTFRESLEDIMRELRPIKTLII